MYRKIIGSSCFMVTASMIGILKAKQLDVRVKRLMEMKRMMIFLQGELRFHRATLSEAFTGVSKRLEEPFGTMLKKIAEQMDQQNAPEFSAVWQEVTKPVILQDGFSKSDEALFEILQTGLGYLDLNMQTETIRLAILRTEEAIEDAKEQQGIKGKLYRTIGVTTGAFLSLLII